MMRLNLLWIGFTLAGGLILGLGPATVAAYALARRHATGESIQTAEFWAVYRGEFGRGSLLVLPAVALITVLTGDYLYFSALGPGATAPRLVTLAALLSRLARETQTAVVCATHDPLLIEQADAQLALAPG